MVDHRAEEIICDLLLHGAGTTRCRLLEEQSERKRLQSPDKDSPPGIRCWQPQEASAEI